MGTCCCRKKSISIQGGFVSLLGGQTLLGQNSQQVLHWLDLIIYNFG